MTGWKDTASRRIYEQSVQAWRLVGSFASLPFTCLQRCTTPPPYPSGKSRIGEFLNTRS